MSTGTIYLGSGRENAIKSGALVDISDVAEEAGFKYPVGLSKAVATRLTQGEDWRQWDVVFMAALAVKKHIDKGPSDPLDPYVTSFKITLKMWSIDKDTVSDLMDSDGNLPLKVVMCMDEDFYFTIALPNEEVC